MAAQLTKEQAEAAIGKVIAVLEKEATMAKLLGIVEAVNKLPAEQQQMAKMMQLMPAVQQATAPVMVEFGFPAEQAMMFMMQLQQHAATSAIVKDGVAKLQATMAGKVEAPAAGGGGAAKPALFHLVPVADWEKLEASGEDYLPATYGADGFTHMTEDASVLLM